MPDSSGYPAGAQHDPAAPWRQPDIDPRTQRAIDRKADADEWLRDNRDLPEVEELLWLSIGVENLPLDPDVALRHMKAVEWLREMYVRQAAHIYRERAETAVLEEES